MDTSRILAQVLEFLTRADVLTALAALVLAFPAAYFARWFLHRVVAKVAARTTTTLDDELIEALSPPLFYGVLLLAVYIALSVLRDLDPYQAHVNAGLQVAFYILAIYIGVRVLRGLVDWYGREVAARTKSEIDDKLLPVVRRVGSLLLYALGTLLVLDAAGIKVTPLLAGLGIGGLAVALAFQPTLGNFFAGTYILSDGSIRPGDFVELEGGLCGTVLEVGWRTTKMRTLQNNLVIIPNAKLADAIVTNYQQPEPPVRFFVECGVSYDSDLYKVERVALEVAQKVLQEAPGAVKDFAPVFIYTKFGDSNIEFGVALQARSYRDQFQLKHAFIQQITHRFRQEEIEISYPVRNVYLRNGSAAALLEGAKAKQHTPGTVGSHEPASPRA